MAQLEKEPQLGRIDSITGVARVLMERLHQEEPFPLDPRDFHRQVMGDRPSFGEEALLGLPKQERESMWDYNMRQCLHYDSVMRCRIEDTQMWVLLPTPLPAYPDIGGVPSGVMVPPIAECYEAVLNWAEACRDINKKRQAAYSVVVGNMMIYRRDWADKNRGTTAHAGRLESFWPDLYRLIKPYCPKVMGAMLPLSSSDPAIERAAAENFCDDAYRDQAIATLNKALLFPPKEPTAWIGRPRPV